MPHTKYVDMSAEERSTFSIGDTLVGPPADNALDLYEMTTEARSSLSNGDTLTSPIASNLVRDPGQMGSSMISTRPSGVHPVSYDVALECPAWTMALDVKIKIFACGEALKQEFPHREDRASAGYYTVHKLFMALKSAQASARTDPDKEIWLEGMSRAQHASRKLNEAWGDGGDDGGLLVKKHWSGIKSDMEQIENLFLGIYLPTHPF